MLRALPDADEVKMFGATVLASIPIGTATRAACLYEALPKDTPRRLVHIDGAGHPDILRHDAVWDTIEQWVMSLPR